METSKRAGYSQDGPRATVTVLGGQGVHGKVESEGHGDKCRAAIDGDNPQDEPVCQKRGKVRAKVKAMNKIS